MSLNSRNMIRKSGIKYLAILFLALTLMFYIFHTVGSSIGNIKVLPEDKGSSDVKSPKLVESNNSFFLNYKGTEKVNILLLGINTDLTDTIMLASLDVDKKHIDLISIPRDTFYPRAGFKGKAEKKMNAAYQGKVINTAKAVSDLLLGMPIDYYAVVDLKGVKAIVDSMGGVPVNVPFHMYYKDPYDKPPLLIDIPKGYQVLDGETAVKFLRFRKASKGYDSYPESDIDRQKAQQQFIKAAFKQSLGPNALKVAKTTYRNVKSDIDIKAAFKLASECSGMTSDNISTHLLPGVAESVSPYYYLPDVHKTQQLINQIYSVGVSAVKK